MPDEIAWLPDEDTVARARLTEFMKQTGDETFAGLHARSVADPAWFAGAVFRFLDIRFEKPYDRVLDDSNGPEFPQWCIGGELNIGTACLAKGRDKQPAVAWEGEEGVVRSWSYKALRLAVDRCAAGLRARGIGKGDAVGVHLPMMPETVAVMVALARIGAIAVPLFTGFGPSAIAARLRHVGAKAVFTANAFPRRGKIVESKAAIDEAAAAPLVIVVERVENHPVPMDPARDLTWNELCSLPGSSDPEPTAAEDPLLLIYTSGTTGAPKGILHTHCGFPVKSAQDMALNIDAGARMRVSWITDIGWMMGPWLIYGSLLLGATLTLYDGAPDYPAPDRIWQFCARQEVEILGISPTLIRSLAVHGSAIVERHDLSRLRILASTGEPWNPEPWQWLFETVGKSRLPIINYSGGTEISGGILSSNPLLPIKHCAFAAPCPGIDADVVDDQGRPLRGAVGELVIRKPWIGMARGFYGSNDRYLETYWSTFPGIWRHGDFAEIDEEGQWYIRGRSDDTIKIAGKRVGPAEVESILTGHPSVIEAAAIGIPDERKGSELVVFCVLRAPAETSELKDLLARELGKPLRPSEVHLVDALPKTRNGKVMRRLLRAARLGLPLGDTSNLENPQCLAAIERIPR